VASGAPDGVAGGAEVKGRLARAIEALDAANAEDPTRLELDGELRPKELAHAELATRWVRRLRPDAGEELLLAARGHHLRRWAVPRSSSPAGRDGYLRWRADLQQRHAEEVGAILRAAGYGAETVARVGAIVRKERLRSDPEVQTLEDALCLIFLATQYEELRARLDAAQMEHVLRRTWRKMSPPARELALALPLSEEGGALVERALAGAGPASAR
jgi:hypothetical protein